MGDYNLLSDEAVVLKNERAFHPVGRKNGTVGELVLTNFNIIYIKKGVLGGTKEVLKFPLNQIKIIDEKPQMNIGKRKNGDYQLEIYFQNSEEFFYFDSFRKKEIIKWMDKISEILTGEPAKLDSAQRSYIPGVYEFADTVKNTLGTVKQALGIKEKEVEKVTTRCMSCGAPIFGEKDSVVKCKFCGTKQTLK